MNEVEAKALADRLVAACLQGSEGLGPCITPLAGAKAPAPVAADVPAVEHSTGHNLVSTNPWLWDAGAPPDVAAFAHAPARPLWGEMPTFAAPEADGAMLPVRCARCARVFIRRALALKHATRCQGRGISSRKRSAACSTSTAKSGSMVRAVTIGDVDEDGTQPARYADFLPSPPGRCERWAKLPRVATATKHAGECRSLDAPMWSAKAAPLATSHLMSQPLEQRFSANESCTTTTTTATADATLDIDFIDTIDVADIMDFLA